jgi:uncharacterized protein YutD
VWACLGTKCKSISEKISLIQLFLSNLCSFSSVYVVILYCHGNITYKIQISEQDIPRFCLVCSIIWMCPIRGILFRNLDFITMAIQNYGKNARKTTKSILFSTKIIRLDRFLLEKCVDFCHFSSVDIFFAMAESNIWPLRKTLNSVAHI